jgi:hypothetical protein
MRVISRIRIGRQGLRRRPPLLRVNVGPGFDIGHGKPSV